MSAQYINQDFEKLLRREKVLNPKVSIVVPAYNADKYIFKCLESIVSQTLEEIEIIVINDGSTDKTLEIAEKFAEIDKRIKIINQLNQKQGAARNRGIEAATGEYIGFVDSDDWIDLDYFENLYNVAKKYASDITTTNILKHKRFYNKYNVRYKKIKSADSPEDKIRLCEDRKHRFFNVMNKLYKITLLKENNIVFPEGCFFEDVIFSIKTIYCANKIVSCPTTKYHYNENLNSTINLDRNSDKKQKARKDAYIELQKFAKENSIKLPERINYCEKYWLGILKVYKGYFKKKIMLFGMIPIYIKK